MSSRSLTALLLVAFSNSAFAATYSVNNASQLQSALSSVRAGDEIVIAAGQTIQYTSGAIGSAYFYANANGTASQPITIRSASSADPATIRGNDVSSKILLHIEGDYWIVKDLKLANGQKGIVFDNSNYSKAVDCEVSEIGLEAIHVRDGSDHVLIDGCWIYNTGLSNPQFGEGIYIGSDRSVWDQYDSSVDHTVVQNSTIGPNVRAEAFDVKEGTTETTIQNNVIYGTGISAAAFEDSFIDLKGVRSYVRFNTFNQGSEPKILRGIAVLDRDRPLSGYEHVVHDNVFNMDDATTPLLEAYSGTSEVYAYNNTRNPAGVMYASSVIQAVPSWYDAPGGGNQPPSVNITSAIGAGGLNAGNPITISASASDSDGTVARVAFYRGTILIGTDTAAPYAAVWSNPAAGSYSLTAVATDNEGATRTSSAFPLTVAGSGGGGGNPNLVMQYQRGDTLATDNKIRAHFRIKNSGAAAVNLSDLKFRYWFAREGTGSPVFNTDYAAIGTGNVSGTFVATGGSGYYLEVSFASAAGMLAAGSDTGAIKLRISTSTNSDQTESNDYSFGPNATSYQDWQKVALYRSGSLIWGVAP